MAGSQKEFELLFKLKAALGGGFNGTFKNAIDTNKKLQDSLKSVNSIQSKIDGYTKQASAIDKNKEKLQALTQEHDKLQRELNQTQEPSEALRKKLEKNENQIQQTTAKIRDQTNKLNSLGDELKQAGISTDNLGGANTKLQKSYDKLKSSQERLQKINSEQAKIKESISNTKTQLLGTIGTIAAVAAAVYAGPVQAAQKYETAMAKVSTIADLKVVPLDKMSSQIMKLSNTTGIAASAIADDVYNAISAGQSTADAVNFVTNSTKLAKAGFAESSQTLDVLTTILNAYGMEANKVGSVSDMLIQIQNKGKVTVAELSSVMGKIIPTANSYGVSLEQLGAGYAIMTSKGIAAAETTTYMNSMLNELGKSGTIADKLLRKTTGSSFKQLMTSGKSMGEVLGILQEQAGKSGKSLADMFGSAEAGKAAVSLLSGGVDGFNQSVQGMIDSAGATGEAFAKMDKTTEAKMAKAKNSIANLGIVLGQNLLPIVGDLADKVAKAVTKVSEFAQANPKLVSTALKVVGVLAALKVGLLTTRLGVLSAQKDFLFIQGIFTKFAGNAAVAEAASVGLGGRLKNVGGGILSYFGNVKGAMGGVSNAVGNIFTNSPILSKVSGFVGGINSKIITGLSGIAGKAAGVLTGAGSKMVGLLLKPFLGIGGRLGGILANVGGIILKSPLGTIGRVLVSGFSSFVTLLAPIGNLLRTTFAPLARLGVTLLGPLGGIVGKLFPIIAVVTLVITVFELVRKNLDKIRGAIENIFGEKGVAVFDKVIAVITNIGNAIKGVFSDGNLGAARDKINEIFGEKGVAVFDVFVKAFEKIKAAAGQFINFVITHIVPVAEDVLNLITTSIIPGIVGFVKAAAPTIMSIIQSVSDFIGAIIPVIGSFIAGLMPVISQIIAFIQTYVLPIIGQVFSFITGTVFPMIAAGIQAILPIITNILSTLLPFIQTAITTIWNIVQPIIQGILAAIQFAMPTIQAIIETVIGTVTGIIQGLMTVLGGIITFITGVFTGNWSQAWEGIKTIFSGIWQGISAVCKGVINGIITAVNVVIRGLNKLKVPDWVPGLGGKGINIAEIPMLAKGARRTPETFIAGEAGPELITNSPGRTVFTANQTKRILESQSAANETAAAVKGAPGITNVTNSSQSGPQTVNNYGSAPEVVSKAGQNGGNRNITITNSTTIVVEGEKPGDLDAKLAKNNADLLQQVEHLLDKKDDDERRSHYD